MPTDHWQIGDVKITRILDAREFTDSGDVENVSRFRT